VLSTNRGFTTYTGTFRGVGVSVIATGMGTPMADFMLREVRKANCVVSLMFLPFFFFFSFGRLRL
jgi:uridine phosphorylase